VTTPQEPRRRRHAGPPQDPYGQQPAPPDRYERPPGYGQQGESFFTEPLPPPAGYERAPGYGQQPGQARPRDPYAQYQQPDPRYTQSMPPPGYQQQPQFGPPQPPGPGRPRRRRHTARNVILSALGGLVVIIVIASVASSGGGSASPSVTPSGAAASSAAAAPAAAPGIGHAVHDGDFSFTVKSVTCGAAAAAAVGGQDGFGETIPPGAAECIATMIVTDDKAEAQTFFDNNQYAYDKAGKKLSADTDGGIYLTGDQEGKQLNPGITITALVPFQIPAGDSIVRLELHDSAFSGGATVQVAG
jgi:hypothetical protein